jgi:hypothetical protein
VIFYLGTHKPRWLWEPAADFPLFVSHRTLRHYRKLRPGTHRWVLDSGGFSELSQYGAWRTTAGEYVAAVRRYVRDIGCLDWAAPQDWMCEPSMLAATGLTVGQHQRRTIASFTELTGMWRRASDEPSPFVPILQGWALEDYQRCVTMYEDAGVDLAAYPAVGVGSVCRRQSTGEIGAIFGALAAYPVHGFGVKTLGIQRYGGDLTSCDSLAWSYDARRTAPMAGHTHKSCANCLTYAKEWRGRLESATQYQPAALF